VNKVIAGKKAAFLASFSGVFQQLIQLVCTFIYRTVFLTILSKEYLGLNGLFTNILQLFSLAELGIGTIIVYRMYKPFAEKDYKKISEYCNFYKKIYLSLFFIIIFIGIIFLPFIKYIVDFEQVPKDINIYIVYLLFVIQSAASYLFVYKQSILIADQQMYAISIFNSIIDILGNVVRIILLIATRNYTFVLFISIVVSLLCNMIFSKMIVNRNKNIFQYKKAKLSRREKKEIFKDTSSVMCHNIGSLVVTSTDNIILSKFVGLSATGIYSNYATILTAVTNLVSKFLGNFTSVIANYSITSSKEDLLDKFYKLLFANLWITSFTAVCIYSLINNFIAVWLGDSFLLDDITVLFIVLQYYIRASDIIASSFINACGLFVRDKIRPLIESLLNIVISIVMVQKIGIAGVFVGTVVSGAVTFYWRKPYILFKHVFKTNGLKYVQNVSIWAFLTVLCCTVLKFIDIFADNWLTLIGKAAIYSVSINIFYILIFYRTEYFKYYFNLIRKKLGKLWRSKK